MGDTKEAILTTALQLFAGNGYEAVSVSEIAGALGMTKGALYKHYKNKRDIFDHILIRMEQRDAEQAGNCEMPEGTLEEMEEQYRDISMEQICLHHQESGMQGLRRFVCMQQCSFFTVFMTEQRIRKVQRSNSRRR